jgi:formylglycine-generating enzyme required for sulfatase activity
MKNLLLLTLSILYSNLLLPNNINVSNVTLLSQNTSAGVNNSSNFSLVQFNLSWENSWRVSTGPSNWDAAWVFVKFRVGASDPTFTGVNSTGTTVTVSSTANLRVGMPVRVTSGTGLFAANTVITSITNATQLVVSATPTTPLSSASIECIRIWEHARLNNTGHTAASGSTIDAGLLTPGSAFNATTNPALGAFIYRSANGSGTNTFNNTQLRWNYGANGINDNMEVSVGVIAIEMVNVPQGSFFVGSGGQEELGSFTDGSYSTNASRAQANVSLSGTSVNSVSITSAGSGYVTVPNVTFPDDGTHGGSGATAIATISGGVVTSITVTNGGTGYSAVPPVELSIPNTIPFQITTEAALGIDNTNGNLWGTSTIGSSTIGNTTGNPMATLNADYPKGYAAFYCMKYEISQGQYRDFLNALTYQQQATRTAVVPTSAAGTGALQSSNDFRNGLDIQIPGNATTLVPAVYGCNLNANTTYNEAADGEWIACNLISWMDGCAYLQWSGLRPMTELEFEKACRGNQTAVREEYAWGNTTYDPIGSETLTNAGANNETSNNTNNNVANSQDNILGPVRVGSFARAATTRTQAGATYYGIMDMSGNLWETTVTIGNATGRSFTGLHGSGSLNAGGNATTASWPGIVSGALTGAIGSGLRGGSWDGYDMDLRVSDRQIAVSAQASRNGSFGIRGVRRAP